MSLRSFRSQLDRVAAQAPRCAPPVLIRRYRKGEPPYQFTEADRCSCGILGHNITVVCEVVMVGRNPGGGLIDSEGDVWKQINGEWVMVPRAEIQPESGKPTETHPPTPSLQAEGERH